MDITFEFIGRIAVWMFVAELILMILFEKSGKQFKWRIKGFLNNLNPYIKKGKYILTAIAIFFGVAIIQNLTNFVDILLIKITGSSFLLYLIAFAFDFFFISHEIAGVTLKNNWSKIPLILFFILIVITIIIRAL